MSAKIEKIKDNIVITIPFWSKRINPYMPDEDVGSYPTLAGMIYTEKGEEKIGFVYVIDMDYKGKPDQYGEIMYHYLGEEDNFRKLCKELEIDIIEYSNCAYCGDVLLGSYTMGAKGDMCFSCQLNGEK